MVLISSGVMLMAIIVVAVIAVALVILAVAIFGSKRSRHGHPGDITR